MSRAETTAPSATLLGVCAAATALAVYFYPLTNFALHIDTETEVVYTSIWQTISLGRWGIALLHSTLLPEPAVPYFTPLLSLLLLAAAAVAGARCFALDRVGAVVFVTAFASFPQFAYQLEFTNQSECIALGLLCTLGGSLLWARGGAWRQAAGVALCSLGVGFYQSLLFVMPTLWAATATHAVRARGATGAQVVRSGLGFLLLTAAAAVLSVAVGRAVQHVYGIPNAGGYLSQMVGWRRHALLASAEAAVRDVLAYMSGGRFYGNGLYLLGPVAAVAVVLLPWGPPASAGRRVATAVLAAITLTLPFALIVMLGAPPPPRTYLAEPVAVAALLAMLPSVLPGIEAARIRALAAGMAAVLLAACFHVSRLFYADTAALAADLLLGNRVVAAIYQADPAFDAGRTPVWFDGAPAVVNVWRGQDYDVFGVSFFTWDGGNPVRIAAFLKVAGVADLRLASAGNIGRVRAAAAALPVWPDPGAARLIDGVMVVRLGR